MSMIPAKGQFRQAQQSKNQEASLLFRQEIQLSGTDATKALLYTTAERVHGSWEQ